MKSPKVRNSSKTQTGQSLKAVILNSLRFFWLLKICVTVKYFFKRFAVNGEVVDLRTVVDADCELSILTANDAAHIAVDGMFLNKLIILVQIKKGEYNTLLNY